MSSNCPSSDKLYISIGKIAAMWADIEVYVEMVLHQLTICETEYSGHQDYASHILMRHMDIRQKASAASFLARRGPDREDLFKRTKTLMDFVSQELRNSRNRIVHDEWTIRDREIIRTQRKPKLTSLPGSGKWETTLFQETRHENTDWIELEVKKFEDTIVALNDLWRDIRDDRVRAQEQIAQHLPESDQN